MKDVLEPVYVEQDVDHKSQFCVSYSLLSEVEMQAGVEVKVKHVLVDVQPDCTYNVVIFLRAMISLFDSKLELKYVLEPVYVEQIRSSVL